RQAFGRVHRDAAHRAFAEMLRDLENEAVAVVLGFQRVQNLRQMIVELHVDDGADDLRDAALGSARRLLGCCCFRHDTLSFSKSGQSASAPEMISMSSLVI